jgi:hypothetical protein
MGSVAMGAGGSYFFEGYNITETAYCLYCDECGSFDIKCSFHLPMWAAFVLIPTVMVLIGATRRGSLDQGGTIVLMLIAATLIYWLTTDSFKHRHHLCRKCGSTVISNSNTREYPAYDRSVLDVPYEATIKYYVEH